MRKLIFIPLVAAIILAACNGGGSSSSDFSYADSISSATAKQMISHYVDSNVNHSLNFIIKQIYLKSDDVKAMLKNKKISRIKLLVAAYLDTDPNVGRRNTITVLIQLKEEKGGTVSYSYYDITTAAKPANPPLCPPPNDCNAQIED